MRLDTPVYQRMLRYRYNIYRAVGFLPAVGLLVYWTLEHGFKNFNSYILNPPQPGVKKREKGEDIED
ncbi:unnamed protein product [Blepharisma stoltei]|uniref:Uncharacterized protein n=1 Tax=Blepharisma stoltei TaxID=1481888 RepID=A0AAU9K2Z2_9CILI|nr:unnamed protein product [Blepharisma stoltei]